MKILVRALYVDLNSFFASCEQQENPALRGKAVAVVPVLTDTTSVIAASYEAKAFGIKCGTRVGDAKKMCPKLLMVPTRHKVYVRYHREIIQAVDSVIPVKAVCSIDEIACELTGSQRDPDRARELALKVKAAIYERVGIAMNCSVGISLNFLLAKIACDFQKPDGLTILSQEDLPARLLPLKLQDIPGIGRKMEFRLNERGIFTMRDLLLRNESETRVAWGSVLGSRYHRLLKGDWTDFRSESPPKSIGHQHVLPPRERTFSEALLVAARLLSKAAVRLRGHDFMARRLSLSVKYIGPSYFNEWISFHETQDTGCLLRSLKELYLKSPRDRVPLRISVTFSDFVPQNQHQLSFFENEKRNHAYQAVDRINEKFGRDTIYTGPLHGKLSSGRTGIAFARIPGLEEFD